MPFNCRVDASSGSSTPETTRWLKSTVALPYTTLAMLNPAEPPICRVGDVLVSVSPAVESEAWFQSNRSPPVTDVRFRPSEKLLRMSFRESTPCSWARPKVPIKPVYLRVAAPSPTVRMPSFMLALDTANPTAVGSLLVGKATLPNDSEVASSTSTAPDPI